MTLLEVMVAMVILSISGMAFLNVAGGQIRNVNYLEEKQFAAWVAENKMVSIFLMHNPPELNWQKDNVEMAGRTWHRQVRWIATTVPELYRIEIEVRSNSISPSPLTTLYSYQVMP
jgi:general secretion pathway protein I